MQNEQKKQGVEMPIFMPVLSLERFAELAGVPLSQVESWKRHKHLPTVRMGNKAMVDIIAWMRQK